MKMVLETMTRPNACIGNNPTQNSSRFSYFPYSQSRGFQHVETQRRAKSVAAQPSFLSSHISPIPRSPISEAQAFLSASGYLSIDQDGDGPSHPTRRSPRCPPDQSNRSLRLHPRIPQPHQSRRRPDHPCQAPLISWTLSLTRSAHPTRI